MNKFFVFFAVFLIAVVVANAFPQPDGDLDNIGKKLEEAINSGRDSIKEAWKNLEESDIAKNLKATAEDLGKKAQSAADDIGKRAQEAIKNIQVPAKE